MPKRLHLFCLVLCSFLSFHAFSQSSDSTSRKLKLNVTADLVSRYIWRGCDYGNSPAVQPTLALLYKNLEVGCWGSVALASFYKEVDLYAKYSFKGFSATFTDYYIPSVNGTPSSPDTRYLIYEDKKTAHSLEGSLGYKGSKVPFWISGSMFFYGNDKRWGCNADRDSTETTYYSTYLEAGYSFPIQDKNLDVFLGFTPWGGAYGTSAGVINTGLTGSGKIRITEHYELPVKASLILNPQTSSIYFVFGITI